MADGRRQPTTRTRRQARSRSRRATVGGLARPRRLDRTGAGRRKLDRRFNDAGAHRLRGQPAGPRLSARGPRALRRASRRAQRARRCVPGAIDGAAGGALCGDLIRVSVRVERRPRGRRPGFDAEGCGALTAAGSAAVTLVEGEPLLDAARVGTHDDRRGARRALARQAARGRPGRGRAASRARRRGRATRAVPRRRRPHARGDERRRGLRRRRAAACGGGRRRGHAGAVARRRRTTPRRPAARPTPSGSRASVAHGMGLPHFTLDLRAGVPRGRRRPVPGRLRGGGDPEPVRAAATATCGSTRCSSSPTGSARPTLATGHYARVTEDGLLRAAADPAKDQAYMLAALAPASLAPHALPARPS